MSDLIDRQAAIEAINTRRSVYSGMWGKGLSLAVDTLRDLPSAQPVRHGHWQITDAYPHNIYCSECHTRFAQTHWAVWEDGSLPREFCPNCGARMDGEQNDDPSKI